MLLIWYIDFTFTDSLSSKVFRVDREHELTIPQLQHVKTTGICVPPINLKFYLAQQSLNTSGLLAKGINTHQYILTLHVYLYVSQVAFLKRSSPTRLNNALLKTRWKREWISRCVANKSCPWLSIRKTARSELIWVEWFADSVTI